MPATAMKARKLSGRHQISQDGKRLIDGVPFGRPLLRYPTSRPSVQIPPAKKRRLDNEQAEPANSSMNVISQGLMLQADFDDEEEDDDDFMDSEENSTKGASSPYVEDGDMDVGLEGADQEDTHRHGNSKAVSQVGRYVLQSPLGNVRRSKRLSQVEYTPFSSISSRQDETDISQLASGSIQSLVGNYENPLLDHFSQQSQPETGSMDLSFRSSKRASVSLSGVLSTRHRGPLVSPTSSRSRQSTGTPAVNLDSNDLGNDALSSSDGRNNETDSASGFDSHLEIDSSPTAKSDFESASNSVSSSEVDSDTDASSDSDSDSGSGSDSDSDSDSNSSVDEVPSIQNLRLWLAEKKLANMYPFLRDLRSVDLLELGEDDLVKRGITGIKARKRLLKVCIMVDL